MRQFLKDTIIAARNAVYKAGAPIKGAAVERLLKEFSLVPTLVSYLYFIAVEHLFYLTYRTPSLTD
jgi:hypothetical protein